MGQVGLRLHNALYTYVVTNIVLDKFTESQKIPDS